MGSVWWQDVFSGDGKALLEAQWPTREEWRPTYQDRIAHEYAKSAQNNPASAVKPKRDR
jgi:hypothetical protein